MRCSGNAEQFTATNGAPRRGPPSWIARARRSFPAPVSPTVRAPALRCGTSRAARARSFLMAWPASGSRVTFAPLDRLALGAPGRDEDGSHLGRRRDGVGGADEVDRRAQVQGEVIPESLERLRQGDHAQSRHGNTSSATQLPPRPFARYSARSAAAMSRASETPPAARERSARPPLTVTLIGASDAPTLSQIRSATNRAARASVSGRMTANPSPP